MSGVALFVDHENVFIGLKELLGLRSPDRNDPVAKAAYQSQNQALAATLATGLRREAEKLGPLRVAFAVANFQQFDFFHHPGIYAQCGFEPRYNVTGRNNADTFITNLVNDMIADVRFANVDTFILVTGDGGFFYLVKMLVDQQRKVRFWGVTGHTSSLMQGLAAQAVIPEFVDQLVDFTAFRVSTAAANSQPPPTPPLGLAIPRKFVAAAPAASHPRPALVAAYPGPQTAPIPPRPSPGLSDLQVLLATFDEHLCASRLEFLSPRLFLDFLERYHLGGSDEASRSHCLQEALHIGVLKEEKIWLGDREGLRVQPNHASDLVSRYWQVRDGLFGANLAKCLHPGDSFRPKRSFVVSTIVRSAPGLEPDAVHRWLDWFVQRGVLTSTYERLPKDLQAANILKLNTDHPMVQTMLAASVWERVSTPLLVMAVDSLLRVPKRPWVALSLLLRKIGEVLPVSREGLRIAVGRCLQHGLLVKNEYPNPRRPEPTSGVHLGEAAETLEVLNTARQFVTQTIELARPSGQVPISFLIQQCAAAGLCGGEFERVKDWITILEKTGLLILRGVPHPALPGQTMTVVSPDLTRCHALLGAGSSTDSADATDSKNTETADLPATMAE